VFATFRSTQRRLLEHERRAAQDRLTATESKYHASRNIVAALEVRCYLAHVSELPKCANTLVVYVRNMRACCHNQRRVLDLQSRLEAQEWPSTGDPQARLGRRRGSCRMWTARWQRRPNPTWSRPPARPKKAMLRHRWTVYRGYVRTRLYSRLLNAPYMGGVSRPLIKCGHWLTARCGQKAKAITVGAA